MFKHPEDKRIAIQIFGIAIPIALVALGIGLYIAPRKGTTDEFQTAEGQRIRVFYTRTGIHVFEVDGYGAEHELRQRSSKSDWRN